DLPLVDIEGARDLDVAGPVAAHVLVHEADVIGLRALVGGAVALDPLEEATRAVAHPHDPDPDLPHTPRPRPAPYTQRAQTCKSRGSRRDRFTSCGTVTAIRAGTTGRDGSAWPSRAAAPRSPGRRGSGRSSRPDRRPHTAPGRRTRRIRCTSRGRCNKCLAG